MRGINSTDKRRVRQALHAEADGRCAYCNRPTSLRAGTVDHYLPEALGGANARSNLRWSCRVCNEAKDCMHPDEWEQRKPEPFVGHPTRHETRCALLQRIAQRARVFALLFLVLLAGFGGGDWPEHERDAMPPACQEQPKGCA